MPELAAGLAVIRAWWGTKKQEDVLSQYWQDLKNETIDYAIMEKAERVAVLPAGGLGWSDVGMWSSLFEVLLPDMSGNIATNMNLHLAHETHNTLVYGGGGERLGGTIWVGGMGVVGKRDIFLWGKKKQ